MTEEKPQESHFASSLSSLDIQRLQRIVQNFFLLWIDPNIDESSLDFHNSLAQLRSVINDVTSFKQQDDAIDFLTDIHEMNAFLIVTNTVGQQILPLIHDIPIVNAIYILTTQPYQHQQWTEKWSKIKGIHTDIPFTCKALQLAVEQCDQNSIPVSFVTLSEGASNVNLNRLEPSFMYTQLFKEILLEMEDEENSVKVLTDYCRQFYHGNARDIRIIDEFVQKYRPEWAIWWYTRECFTYRMLNQALRALEGDTIINMGFFMRDLHRQIQQLHSQQVKTYNGKEFIVYRGQGLSKVDFDKLMATEGGLISFNSFLSTSTNQDVSLRFARNARSKTNSVGILFRMTIPSAVSSTPFACISQYSYHKTEEEILFSMHAVFRVDQIIKLDMHGTLYEVHARLTADNDQELRTLTGRIREEIVGRTGWDRLGSLLIQLNQLEKAENLCNMLSEETCDMDQKASRYHQLGHIRREQGNYEDALLFSEKDLEIKQATLPANHPSLATCYGNVAGLYHAMGEYSKALSFYDRTLEIYHQTLPGNHPSLATCYGNMAGVYQDMGEYSKALSFYEKDLEIKRKTLPANHPSLGTCYGNMAAVYQDMGEYSKALSLYEKDLEIKRKTLPANHPSLATCYGNMAGVYRDMGEYSKALSLCKKDLEICQKTLPANHPSLGTCYGNMAGVYQDIGEYSKALSFYEKDLEILHKTLPANHPSLATCYGCMAAVYRAMGEYSKALSFYERTLEIRQKTLPANHPLLATCYGNMASVYYDIDCYAKSRSYYERASSIMQISLPVNHPHMKQLQKNIDIVKQKM